jgi:hypothetical protein
MTSNAKLPSGTRRDLIVRADLGELLPGGAADLSYSNLPYVRHVQPTSKALFDPNHRDHVNGMQGSDFLVPHPDGDGFDHFVGRTGFDFVVAMMTERWIERSADGKSFVGIHNAKPPGLCWPIDRETGRKKCVLENNNRVDHQIVACLLIRGRTSFLPAAFTFASTSRDDGKDLGRRVGRWKVNGKYAPMIGLFNMRSEPRRNEEGNWYGPKITVLGKAGEANGPDAAMLRAAALMRAALKEGGAIELPESEPPDPPPQSTPSLEKPKESQVPPSPGLSDRTPKFTSGKQVSDAPREQAPPPISEDDYGLDDPTSF